MLDLADVHPAFNELGTRSLDVGDDQVHTPGGARHRVRDPRPDGDRARRAWRRQLHYAELLTDAVVEVQLEASLLSVKGLGTVHVRDGDQNELEPQIHHAASSVWA